MSRLLDGVQAKEQEQKAKPSVKKPAAVTKIVASDGKDKQISAKVNEKTYAMFTKINKAYGLSNNSTLNMLISEYVRDKKDILKDEDMS